MISLPAISHILISLLFGVTTALVAFYGVGVVDAIASSAMGLPSLGPVGCLWAALAGCLAAVWCRTLLSRPVQSARQPREASSLYGGGDR